ncbi:MAG: UPF0149 family protein [bacterium]
MNRREFQNQIFLDLEHKLRSTPWNSGASEAHGLICGLACSGVTADTIRTRAYLFQLSDLEHIEIIEGMFSLAERDLQDDAFSFELMLPPDDASQLERGEALSSWCQGFLQGICHDNADALTLNSAPVKEALEDILQIGHIELDPNEQEQNERSLSELEEFLRVAAQLIYDELKPASIAQSTAPSTLLN